MSRAHVLLVALGVVVGAGVSALVVQPSVRAQASYSECGFLTMPNASNGADMAGRAPEHPIRIPSGWTPVGGGTYRDQLPGVVVCH